VSLNVEELEERIAPSTVGALHNNPDNPNNNNNHNAVPNGAIPEGGQLIIPPGCGETTNLRNL
jgi:hypothetical protein